MQVTKKDVSDTKVTLSISADDSVLAPIKEKTLMRLSANVKVPGFREGTAPLAMVEKHVDPQLLQSEFVDEALNHMYAEAARAENLRPVASPNVTLKKFVPFTTLEFEAEVEILGTVKLPDYKKLKKTVKKAEVTVQDINKVIDDLKKRMAEKKDVDRAAKEGDQVWIDFKGVDAKGEPVKGADGKEYPLLLGSDTFIPGFEKNLLGQKPGSEKTFTLTFPKDYGVAALANKKVTFTVTVSKVQEVVEPAVDDAFAAKLGPFTSLSELKSDIKKQLAYEKQQELTRDLDNEIVKEIAEKTKLSVPESLVAEQVEFLLRDLKQNLLYRGQTYNEFLESEGKTAEQYEEGLKPQAEMRVKTGLVLAEIASEEKIDVTPEEVEIRLQILKGQYKDQAAQGELDKPEARREVASQLMSEKTLTKLREYIVK